MTTQEYVRAEARLQRAYAKVRDSHSEVGQAYVAAHWARYACTLAVLPPLSPEAEVLEIGASILSNALSDEWQAHVTAVYHELEPEWRDRFARQGVRAVANEMLRDTLPFTNERFDVILFNEVLEHLPVKPDFLLSRLFSLLKPSGQIIITTPNFAWYRNRLLLLAGLNPQPEMDERFVYYAHHREPVMRECLQLIEKNGGRILEHRWTDFRAPVHGLRRLRRLLGYASHFEVGNILTDLVPSLRRYLLIRTERAPGAQLRTLEPPIRQTREFIGELRHE